MKDPKKVEKSPIGYINPMFPVKIALAALGDGEKMVGADIKGSVEDMLALFAYICDAVTDKLVGCCACESESEKEEAVTGTVASIVATTLAKTFGKLEKEDEENEQSV